MQIDYTSFIVKLGGLELSKPEEEAITKILNECEVPAETVVMPKIAEEKELNRHNKDIIHYSVCRECGNMDLLNDECKYYKNIPR